MKKILLLSLLMGFQFSTAEEIKDLQSSQVEPNQEAELSEKPTRKTSQELRKNQSMMATGQVAGLGPLSSNTIGTSFGFYIDQNSILDFSYQLSSYMSFDGDANSHHDIKFETYGTHYKHFVKNSFYVKSGLEYRKLSYSYTSYFTDKTLEESTQFSGSALTANLAIGNQWQWDHFTMGCDWVGVALPITSTVNSEYTGGTFSSNVRRLSDDKQRYLKDTAIYFVQFYLGASF